MRLTHVKNESLKFLADRLGEDVIGQTAAILLIQKALIDYDLCPNSSKPVVTLLFAGGFSSGRRTTAKALAKVLFKSEESYDRILSCDLKCLADSFNRRAGIKFLACFSELTSSEELTVLASFLQRLRDGSPWLDKIGESANFYGSILIVSLEVEVPLPDELLNQSRAFLTSWLYEHCKKKYSKSFFDSFDEIIPFKRFDNEAKERLVEAEIIKVQSV